MAYSKATGARIANTSTPRLPKWTGNPQEFVLIVSIGEPRRSHAEMRRAVEAQIVAYVERFEPPERQLDSGFAYALADTITRAVYHEDHGEGVLVDRPLFEHYLDAVLRAMEKHRQLLPSELAAKLRDEGGS